MSFKARLKKLEEYARTIPLPCSGCTPTQQRVFRGEEREVCPVCNRVCFTTGDDGQRMRPSGHISVVSFGTDRGNWEPGTHLERNAEQLQRIRDEPPLHIKRLIPPDASDAGPHTSPPDDDEQPLKLPQPDQPDSEPPRPAAAGGDEPYDPFAEPVQPPDSASKYHNDRN